MSVSLTAAQREAVTQAVRMQTEHVGYERLLARKVQRALKLGVPLNTLARALGVSRDRVRRLARVEKSE